MHHLSLAARLNTLIHTANSQKEVARLAAVSDGTLINWLRGGGVRESKLRQVARNIGVSLTWLRDGDGNEEVELAAFRARLRGPIGLPRNELRRARERQGWSLAALARRIDCPVALLEQVENGCVYPSEHLLDSLCEVLPGLCREDFPRPSEHPLVEQTGARDAIYGEKADVVLTDGTRGRYVPLLSCAQVGRWETGRGHAISEHIAIFALGVDDREAFAIKVLGNSMEPVFREGDIVVCSPSQQVQNGEVAVLRTRREQVFISYWRRCGERVLVESAHGDYKPIDLPRAEIAGAWPIVQTVNAGKVRAA